MRLWDTRTGDLVKTLHSHSDTVGCVTFSPDGKRLASGCQDRTVKLWDVETGDEVLTLRGHSAGVHSLCFNPNGDLLASGSKDGEIKLWSAPIPQRKPDSRPDR